jgi:two-component system alkaline phosphatase synthesis response regulator PhoP
MSKEKVLVVDDERNILRLLEYNLKEEGYLVKCVLSGEEAIVEAKTWKPQLIILDLMLPGMDGLKACRFLKSDNTTTSIPIIILSAKGEEADIITGLELGAADYVTKPFSPKILIARVKAHLRHKHVAGKELEKRIEVHELIIDISRREVMAGKHRVSLTATEFDLLVFLARRPGWVFTRNQIIGAIKGEDHPVTDRAVDVKVVSLRKKLKQAGRYIETVHGVGYRFKEEQEN